MLSWLRLVPDRIRRLPGALRMLARAFWLVAGLSPRMTALLLSIVLLASALAILQVALARDILNALVAGNSERALLLAAVYAIALMIPPALNPTEWVLYNWFEDRGVAEIDRRLMEAGDRIRDLGHIERPDFHDEVELLKYASYVSPRMMQVVSAALGGLATLAGILALLATLHLLLPVALVLVSLPHTVMEGRVQDLTYQAMAERSRPAREMVYYTRLTTQPAAAKEVRVFGLGSFFLGRFRARFEDALREVTRVRLSSLRTSAIFSGLHALTVAGGFWFVAGQAAAGKLSLGDLALYLNGIIQLEAVLGMIPWWVGQPYMALLYTRTLFRFLDLSGPSISVSDPGQGRPAPATLREGIDLQGVTFGYPGSDHRVLRDVSFTLPAGKITALVGHNGAGKSTIVKLLTRMYDPQEGQILLDGVPLHEYDLDSLRSRIAVVYQDFAQFALTLRENISVGATQPGQANGRIEEAARWSGAETIAARLPHGYDTELTRRFEGGVDLSGGQWQQVALARGFVRDAALVILDEPTSALDADAENRLFERFRELMRGKTALLISHRFSTVRMADQIIVLEDGRVREVGTHADLMGLGGRYAELFEMQAGRYR